MKKFFAAAIIALTAIGFIGCFADDEFKSNVNWRNQLGGGTSVTDIKWESTGGTVNQTWNGDVADTATSDTKEVTVETGKGTCLETGAGATEYEITINGAATAYSLTDGSTETLNITSIAKKK